MTVFIFYFFSMIFFILGLYNIIDKRKSLLCFLILVVFLPIGGVFNNYFFKYYIYSFEFYYIGLFLAFTLSVLRRRRLQKYYILYAFFIFSIFYSVLLNDSPLIYKFKDLKPFFILLTASMFYFYYKDIFSLSNSIHLSLNLVTNLLLIKYCCIVVILYLFGSSFFSNDLYYQINNSIRYSDIGMLFIKMLFFYLLLNKRLNVKFVILFTITLLISGNRTVLMALLLSLGVYFLFYATLHKKIIFVLILPLLIFLVVYVFESRGTHLNFEYLNSFFMNRFSPFFIELSRFSDFSYIFGLGVGHPFYIPWFEYRGLEPYNHSLDNLYLTIFIKQGICSVFTLFFILFTASIVCDNKKFLFLSLCYISILGLTSSIIYQSTFIFLFIFLMTLRRDFKLFGKQ
ncbi:DUF6369 family protein [Vibrio lentus]